MSSKTPHILLVAAPVTMAGGTIRRLALWGRHASPLVRFSLLFSSPSPQKVAAEIEPGIQPLPTRAMDCLYRILVLPGVVRILAAIHRERPDYVLGMFLWSGLAAGLAVRAGRLLGLTRVRLALHVAGDPVPPCPGRPLRRKIYTFVAEKGLLLADDIIPISRQIERMLREEYPALRRKPMHIVPIGVERPEPSRTRSAHNRPVRFGVISRLVPEKGVQYALAALAELAAKGLEAQLDIHGDGTHRLELERLASELGLQDQVRFLGWTDDPIEAMRGFDCLLLPSQAEGTPRSILEAASLGVPAIATNVGGVPDIIRDAQTGWLVPHADVQALQQAMARIMRDPAIIEKAGQMAMDFVRDVHGMQTELSRLAELAAQGRGKTHSMTTQA